MNRTEFFNTVRLAKAKLEVVQVGDKGYKLTAFVQHEGEEKEEITLTYKDDARYFKSVDSVLDILRDDQYNLVKTGKPLEFSIRVEKEEILKVTRATTPSPAPAPAPAPAAQSQQKK